MMWIQVILTIMAIISIITVWEYLKKLVDRFMKDVPYCDEPPRYNELKNWKK